MTDNGNSFPDLVQKTCPTSKQRQRYLQLSLGEIKMENKNWVYKLQFEEKHRASLCFGKMVRRVKDKGHEKEQTNIDK